MSGWMNDGADNSKLIGIDYVPIKIIKPAPFNPASRVSNISLAELMIEIKNNGVLVPIALTRDYELGDGHRRYACAKALGHEKILAGVYDLDLQELWSTLNRGVKAINPKAWGEAAVNGLELDHLPPLQRKYMEKLKEIMLPEEYRNLFYNRVSPSIYQKAHSVGSYCGDIRYSFLRLVILWIVKYKGSDVTTRAIRDGIDPEVLKTAIEESEPLRHGWEIG